MSQTTQPDVPDHLVKQIERALRKGKRIYDDAAFVRQTIGGGITQDALADALAESELGRQRMRDAFEEANVRRDGELYYV